MACKNCKVPQAVAPSGVNPSSQGFNQAQLQGVQYAPSGKAPKSNFWKGTPGYSEMLATQTPQQMQLGNAAGQTGLQLLGKIGQPDYSAFEPIAQQATNYYNEELIPSLAERFTSMGSGAQNSSSFAEQLRSGASDFSQGLAALKSQHGMQQQGLNNNILGTLLSGGMAPQYENIYHNPVGGFKQAIGGGLGSGLAFLLSKLLGGG